MDQWPICWFEYVFQLVDANFEYSPKCQFTTIMSKTHSVIPDAVCVTEMQHGAEDNDYFRVALGPVAESLKATFCHGVQAIIIS